MMGRKDERIRELEAKVAELEGRIAVLEARLDNHIHGRPIIRPTAIGPIVESTGEAAGCTVYYATSDEQVSLT
jgi:hypothetical protein